MASELRRAADGRRRRSPELYGGPDGPDDSERDKDGDELGERLDVQPLNGGDYAAVERKIWTTQ